MNVTSPDPRRPEPILVFFNPRSGPARTRITRAFLIEALEEAGLRVKVIDFDGQDVSKTLEACDPGETLRVVAAGGDGTACAVAGALVDTDRVFGVLPLGTRNHFARDVGLPLDLRDAIGILRDGHIERVDVGEVDGRVFLNNASLGLYPHFVRERRRRMRRTARWIAIAVSAWSAVRRRRHLAIYIDDAGEETRASIVFIGNNRYRFEGIEIGERPSVQEGLLSLTLASVRGPWSSLRLMIRALTSRLEEGRDFQRLEAKQIRIDLRRSRIRVALDGEPMRFDPPLQFRIRPAALSLLMKRRGGDETCS